MKEGREEGSEWAGEFKGKGRKRRRPDATRLTSIKREKGTQAATAQQAPTAATMTVDCQTVLTKKVRNLS